MTSERAERRLLCQFNSINELVKHTWQTRQTLDDDTKIDTCLDQGQWLCSTQSDGVFGTFDFCEFFQSTKDMVPNAKWKLYKNLIPFIQIHYSKYNKNTGQPEYMEARTDVVPRQFDPNHDDYLIMNLSDYSCYFETQLFLNMRLESIYQRFLEKIQTNYFKFLCSRFMPHQERMLTQVATTLANRNGFVNYL